MKNSNTSLTATHHVYILPTHDRSRAKIGRTRNGMPLDRITTLACIYPEIDLSGAVIVEVDTHKIEQMLHIAFGPRRDRHVRLRDGSNEWFLGDIVDEALTFVKTVAAHRGTEYRVIRNIDALIRAHRARNPKLGVRPARGTDAERDQRALMVEEELRKGVLRGAQALIGRLEERRFDSVATFDTYRYLSRVIDRATEPECWSPEGFYRVSDWGQALVALADVEVTVEGGRGHWRFLDVPTFVAIDANHGREYYRIPEPAHCTADENAPDPMLDRAAWVALEQVLAHLPVRAANCDPTRYHSPNVGDVH